MSVKKIYNNIKSLINFIFFPTKCIGCDEVSKEYICNKCKKELEKNFCPKIVESYHSELSCISCFVYQNKVKEIIHNFKFKNHRNASLILSNFLTIAIEKKFKNQKFDSITFVPCYYPDKKYNHSEILAEKISENLGIPLKKHLKKIRENKKQHRLSFSERQENVKGVYQCVEENLQNKNILICDDIITTGATLSECAKELEKSGAKVFCSTVAYTILKTLE